MAFQITPLRIPSLTPDFSAENQAFSRLGEALGNLPAELRKQQLDAQKQGLLGQLTSGTPDYTKIGLGVAALGDLQGGAALIGLGQKQHQVDAGKATADLFAGKNSATPLTPAAPSQMPATTQPVIPGDRSLPRGIRNNNPGNIEAGAFTQGLPGFQGSDGRFARFETPEQGIVAADRLLQSYAGRGLNTVAGIVNRWAPPSENNTGAYVASVARELGVQPDQPLDMASPDVRQKLIAAKIRVENGRQPYGEDVFARAYGRGAPAAPAAPGVQVAETEADVQRLEAQMPGYGGGAAVASVAGDDPVKLRQEAARYQQSNPEAARQFLARAEAAERAGGVQTAQAPATPQADLPDARAAQVQAQGFFIPPGQNALPPNDPVPHLTTQQLMGIAVNPNVPENQRGIAKMVLDSRQKYSDENAPEKREMTRLQTEKLRREVQGEGAVPLTAEERTQFGIAPDQAAYKTRSGEIKFGPAGTKIVNEAQKGENKFEEELGKGQAKRFNDMISEGDVAQGRLADLQTLREASRRLGSQGSSANLKALVGPYAESLNIKVDGLSDIQLYDSITQRLAPTLRQPGSGSQSDIEFKGFLRAIGPLSNTPAAREMILDTFEAASRNDIARADIASRLAQKEITRGQAEREIRALPNPLEAFREFRKQNPDLVGQAIKDSVLTERDQKNAPPAIDSAEAYGRLKPGDKYTDPDGNIRTKR